MRSRSIGVHATSEHLPASNENAWLKAHRTGSNFRDLYEANALETWSLCTKGGKNFAALLPLYLARDPFMAGKKTEAKSGESWRGMSRFLRWNSHDPFEQSFQAPRVLRAQDLAIWTTAIEDTRLANSPDHCSKPVVLSDLVVQSIFSPGKIVAFDRQTGAICWSLPLKHYGSHAIFAKDPLADMIYSGTCQELLAIERATGKVIWSFCPYGLKGESFYSAPAIDGNRLIIGDRCGYLHCIDLATGNTIWNVLASRADRNEVNCDPVVLEGTVIFGTIGGLIVRLDAMSGRLIWKQQLVRSGAWPDAVSNGKILVRTGNSVCLMSTVDGQVLWQWKRNNQEVWQTCFARDLILLLTRWCWGKEPGRSSFTRLRAMHRGVEVYSQPYPRAIMTAIGYNRESGLAYESTRKGLGILDPRTGKRKAIIEFAPRFSLRGNHPHQPSVVDAVIYAADEDGKVYALRHP